MSFKRLLPIAAATAALLASVPAQAAENVKVGTLRCDVSAGLGLIVTSSREMVCTFTSNRGWHERYHGRIQKFGLDIGVTNKGVILWGVYAPTDGPRRHALAGDYVGAQASAVVGVGGGANVLVGGSHRAFTLQPLSIEGDTGVALAAGVANLTLR